MWTKPLSIGCVLWMITIPFSSALETNSVDSPSATSQDERFKIPEITRDERYDSMLSDFVSDSVMHFARNLAVALDQGDFPNAQVFSPLSIMSSLSLLQMGASGRSYNQLSKIFQMLAGDTQDSWKIHEEFGWLLEDVMLSEANRRRPHNEPPWRNNSINRAAFGTGGKNTPNEYIVRVANGMFVQDGFSLRPDYKYAAQSVYKSELTSLDFRKESERAKHYINSWVNQNTMGKIPAIIADEVSQDTNMIIASALYFKGYWEQPFLGSGTAESNFYPDGRDSKPVKVMMMGAGGVYPYYDSTEFGCQIIGLPYKGNQSTMYIIQPRDATRRSLSDLQKSLTGDKINYLISKMERKTAVLALPKFHITSSMHLKGALNKMGIDDIFRNGLSGLSLITDLGQNVPQESAAPTFQNSQPRPADSSLPESSIFQQTPIYERAPASAPPRHFPTVSSAIAQGPLDRYNDAPLIFSRFNDTEESMSQAPIHESPTQKQQPMQYNWNRQGDLMVGTAVPQQRSKRTVTYKVESEFMRSNLPLRLKDLILSKRITKPNPGKKVSRNRRQANIQVPNVSGSALPASAASLQNLDRLRSASSLQTPPLYVDEILHKVDIAVNEQGTEAAAATLTYLRRSGTDVAFRCDAPFLFLIRHDATKLPLFYGKINIPPY